MSRPGFIASVAALAGVLLVAGFVATRAPDPDAVPTTQQVAQRTMSPFCPGLTLDECPSPQAATLRSRIAEMVRERKTNREIDDFLVDNYGEAVKGRPDRPLVWLIPALALPLAVLLVGLRVGRWSAPRAAVGDPAPKEIDPHQRERMLADFERFALSGDE